jgi:hypothetical protein
VKSLKSRSAFKDYLFIKKNCEKEFEQIGEQMSEFQSQSEWKLSVDERIIVDTLSELHRKLEKVLF